MKDITCTDYFRELRSSELDIRHDAENKITAEAQKNPTAIVSEILEELRAGDVNTRWYLGRALIKTGPDIIPILVSAAETETDIDVLKYFGAVFAAYGEPAVEPLINLFSSTNPAARGMAGAALEKIGEPALKPLMTAAASDSAQIRACAGIVLVKLGVYEF